MKSIKSLLLIAAVTFSSVLFAGTNPTKDDASLISNEIGKLLKNPQLTLKEDISASVKIMFNENNEIVVLSVDTLDKGVESFIKSRLNYSKLDNQVSNKNRYYILPVRVTSKK